LRRPPDKLADLDLPEYVIPAEELVLAFAGEDDLHPLAPNEACQDIHRKYPCAQERDLRVPDSLPEQRRDPAPGKRYAPVICFERIGQIVLINRFVIIAVWSNP
jgi:hypothetical protein